MATEEGVFFDENFFDNANGLKWRHRAPITPEHT